jgi:hypothetical protein
MTSLAEPDYFLFPSRVLNAQRKKLLREKISGRVWLRETNHDQLAADGATSFVTLLALTIQTHVQ